METFIVFFHRTSSEGSEDKLSLPDDRHAPPPEQSSCSVKSLSRGPSPSASPGNKSPASLFRERYLGVVQAMHGETSQQKYLYPNTVLPENEHYCTYINSIYVYDHCVA